MNNKPNENLEPYKTKLYYNCEVRKNESESDNDYSFVMTTESIDRHQEIVDAKNMDLVQFKKNPVVFYNHNSNSFPIGKAYNIKREDGRITSKVKLHEITDEAKIVKQLLDEGYIKSVSVGLIVKDYKYDKEQGVYRISKSELIELSVVNIPANTEAMRINSIEDNKLAELNLRLDMLEKALNIKQIQKLDINKLNNIIERAYNGR